jgi:hypothetical protein
LLDNFYLGNSIYFENAKTDVVKDMEALAKADIALETLKLEARNN